MSCNRCNYLTPVRFTWKVNGSVNRLPKTCFIHIEIKLLFAVAFVPNYADFVYASDDGYSFLKPSTFANNVAPIQITFISFDLISCIYL